MKYTWSKNKGCIMFNGHINIKVGIKVLFISVLFLSESYGLVIRLTDKYWDDKFPNTDLSIPGEQWQIKQDRPDRIIFEHELQADLSLYKRIKIEMGSNKAASIRWGWRCGNKDGQDFFSEENLSMIADSKLHQYTFEMKYPDKINPIVDKASKLIIEVVNKEKDNKGLQLKNVELVRHLPSELGQFMLNGLCMNCIPEDAWTFNTKIQKGDRLLLYIGMYNPKVGALSQKKHEKEWNEQRSNFSIDVIDNGEKENIYEYQMNPMEKEDDREWRFIELDLSKFAEKEVQIIFTKNTAVMDGYGLWGNPVIIRNIDDIEKQHPPVFIISCDTMRADHLLPYGYRLPTSPNLDKFAKEAVLFERAYTTRTFTPVAHMSLLTGLFPKNHGVNAELPAYDHVKLLGEYLKELGYYSMGLVGATTWFLPSRGYMRGMDKFYYPPEYLRDVFPTQEILKNEIKRLKYDNLFVFLHNYDVHTRMLPPATIYSSEDARFFSFSDLLEVPELLTAECMPNPRSFFNHIQATLGKLDFYENLYINALYDDCVAKVDYAIGDLFHFLKEQDLYDKSMIIIVADHGEALGEHGRYEHVDVYEHTARVPMMIKFPNGMYAGKRIESLVSLEDIVPTILGYLNVNYENLDGVSLSDIIEGKYTTPRKIFIQNQFQNEEALISDRYKVICSFRESKVSFFDLLQDPLECVNLFDKEDILLKQFLEEMSSYRFFNGEGWVVEVKGKKTNITDEVLICPGPNIISVIPDNIMFWYKKAEEMDCLYGTISYPQMADTYSLYIYPKDMKQELRIGFRSSEKFKVLSHDGSSELINEYEFVLPERYLYWENTPNIPNDGNTYILIRRKPLMSENGQKEVELPEDAIFNIRNTGYL
ncbi:MAG TPA: sulfatase [Candidatus Hydrogenedens sp.]|nr:sulfatase [Candidatus Hydrogenedens sp.]